MTHTPVFLGKAQLPASRVGIGTWAIGGGWGPQPEEQSLAALHEALDRGCLLIDTAPLYGNGRAERLIAQATREHGTAVTVLTKIHPLDYHWAPVPGTPVTSIYSPAHIREQVEGSLRRLRVDCLDGVLFQTWCPGWAQDLSWYETVRQLQVQGKIRTFGISVSDHRAEEANDVIAAGLVDLIEAPYSILDQRAAERLFPLAEQHQVSVIARTPLASGALAEDWQMGMRFPRQDWRRRVFRGELLRQTVERIAMVKAVAGSTAPLAQFALRFCLSHPAISAVIVGVREAHHVQGDLAVLEQEKLSQEEIAQIHTLWATAFRFHVRTSIGEENEGERWNYT